MHINLEPVMYVGRGYQLADGYEQRRPYDLVFSVFKTAEGVARVYAAHGEIDRATFKQISSRWPTRASTPRSSSGMASNRSGAPALKSPSAPRGENEF